MGSIFSFRLILFHRVREELNVISLFACLFSELLNELTNQTLVTVQLNSTQLNIISTTCQPITMEEHRTIVIVNQLMMKNTGIHSF